MRNNLIKHVFTWTALVAGSTVALAQMGQPAAKPAAAPAPPPSAFEEFVTNSKKPVDWLTWGADLRLRNEYFNNALSLSSEGARNEQDYFRFRGRLWMSLTPVKDVSLNTRFSGEFREWMKPSYSGNYGARSGFEERFGIVDLLNVKWANAFKQPLTITAGRQDIMLGDPLNWWLVADGTPGDGSWTFFLDSARISYDAADIKTKFDLIYIYQTAKPDEWMPTLGRSSENTDMNGALKPYNLTEQNEQGVIVYASNKSIKNTQVDGYFIYKRDDKEFANGDDADIYTLGAKVTGTPAEHWQYSAEGAYQFGRKKDPTVNPLYGSNTDYRDISAFGVNAKLTYLFKDKLNNQASLIYEYLSGDDPNSGDDEMFDVLWGRWPRWSELYIYSYVNETGGKIAQLNNIQRLGASWSLNPMKNMNFSATYNALFAPEEIPTRALNSKLFNEDGGNFRGHYVQAVLKHKFNSHVSAHLWSEFVWMGDYYADEDLMTFLRAEVLFNW